MGLQVLPPEWVKPLLLFFLMLRDCRHIKACQTELKDLLNMPGLPENCTTEEAAATITNSNTNSVPFMRCVSHLSIPPPTWCSLPNNVSCHYLPFHNGENLLLLLQLNAVSRCACGNDGPYNNGDIMGQPFTIYGSTLAIQRTIQTVYCRACPHSKGKIGPDLQEYSVFNYNNQWGFTYELLNGFTNRLTSQGETTFTAFHQGIVNAYLEEQSEFEFCEIKIFEHAWFGFVRLQELATNMQCSLCGPNPEVVIADGVAVSFPRHRVMGLHPPTIPSPDVAHIKFNKMTTKCSSFPGPVSLQSQIHKALCESDRGKCMELLTISIENFQSVLLSHLKSCIDECSI